jgi:hypothetical protein
MHIFLTRWVARFVRRERISNQSLQEAIARAELGLVDVDLGGGLIKQRVARTGKGRSGGYRTIIAYRRGKRAVFLYGFAKSDRGNIGSDELTELRAVGLNWLNASTETIAEAIEGSILLEADLGEEKDA